MRRPPRLTARESALRIGLLSQPSGRAATGVTLREVRRVPLEAAEAERAVDLLAELMASALPTTSPRVASSAPGTTEFTDETKGDHQ